MKQEQLEKDSEFGERLLVSSMADKTELADNVRCARAILRSFPNYNIIIREHTTEYGIKNPEYVINGLIADRKGIIGEKGIKWGFISAIDQGCSAVVIDLDDNMGDKQLRTWELAKFISWRYRDFQSSTIVKCYVVYHGRAVAIDVSFVSREQISSELKKLRP